MFILASTFTVFVAFIALLLFIDAVRFGIGPMPTSPKVRRALLSLIPETVDGVVYELGAGWGTLAIAVADRRPDLQVVAVEGALVPFLATKLRLWMFPRKNLRLVRANFFEQSLDSIDGDASLVICYLYPGAMLKLRDKFEAELPVGCVVISHTFALPGSEAESVIRCYDLYHTPIYCYRM